MKRVLFWATFLPLVLLIISWGLASLAVEVAADWMEHANDRLELAAIRWCRWCDKESS
jgi:hypothetical protein